MKRFIHFVDGSRPSSRWYPTPLRSPALQRTHAVPVSYWECGASVGDDVASRLAASFACYTPNQYCAPDQDALIVWGLLGIHNQDSGNLSPKQLWRQLQADIHQAVLSLAFVSVFKVL